MQIVTTFDTKCLTITKGYAKVRSTDPKFQNPMNPDLLRQFSPAEHAKMKNCPVHLVEGMSAQRRNPFEHRSIARDLRRLADCLSPRSAEVMVLDAAERGATSAPKIGAGIAGSDKEPGSASTEARVVVK